MERGGGTEYLSTVRGAPDRGEGGGTEHLSTVRGAPDRGEGGGGTEHLSTVRGGRDGASLSTVRGVKTGPSSKLKAGPSFFHCISPMFKYFLGMFKNTNSVNLCQNSVFAKLSGCQK